MSRNEKSAVTRTTPQKQEQDTTKESVLQVLKKFNGIPIRSNELATFAHTDERQARMCICQLRNDGEPICADERGYWYGTDSEYEATSIADYKSRIKSMSETVNAFYDRQKREEYSEAFDAMFGSPVRAIDDMMNDLIKEERR